MSGCFLCGDHTSSDRWEGLADGREVHRMCFLNNYAYLKHLGLTKQDKSKQVKLKS